MLFKFPYFPANSNDIIVKKFFKVLFLMKSSLTNLGHIICMDYHEKILLSRMQDFFAQVVSPDYLLVIFLILIAKIDVSEDPK